MIGAAKFFSTPKNESNWPAKIYSWLAILNSSYSALPESASVAASLDWSPLKKDKHTLAQPAVSSAPRIILYLLAEKVVTAVFGQAEPALLATLLGFSLSALEKHLATIVQPEITAASLPDAGTLATLQLTPQLTSQKRQGAFYTSPQLARQITTQTLTGLPPGASTVLDPACGGGVFLLVALEFLVEHNPTTDPVELLVGRLYGLDLNPLASGLTRLTLLRALHQYYLARPLAQLASGVIYTLVGQIRCGNALVGRIYESVPPNPNYSPQLVKLPVTSQQSWAKLEELVAPAREQLKLEIAQLPIFNHPDDGRKLAALAPFGWQLEFPAVFAQGGFGAVLGNPPYLGFNDYSGLEKAYFAYAYRPIYNLKSDLLYYFIKRGLDLLQPGGRLGFVTARFWKEAVYAAPLRSWLTTNCRLLAIEDLGGQQFFEDAEVDVCLLYLSRAAPGGEFPFSYAGNTEIIAQARLDGTPWTWLRKLPTERLLLEKIAEQSQTLAKIAQCRTGVQSGLDEVFFLSVKQARELELEASCLRPAIKNADIGLGKIGWRGLQLIYPAPDFDPQKYPALWHYLQKYRERLEKRQRYDKSFPFYQLQWPRELAIFDSPLKLVTPYKAPRNTFALDTQQYYFSTDVISVVFPADWQPAHYIFAQNFLNSQLATFQFRSYGKPMSGGQWDYYANPVKKLVFPLLASPSLAQHPLANPAITPAELNELVCQLYNLTAAERALLLPLI